MTLSWRARRRWALLILLLGMPLYVVVAVNVIGLFERPPVWLELVIYVALGFLWARMAEIAEAKLAAGEGEARFYDTKVKTAAFFFAKLLPQTDALFKTIQAGPETLMAVEADAF